MRGKVSVVVASYNGAATLDACLSGLTQLEYPDYEIIVVDDGSKDRTPEITAQYDIHTIRVPNGGLSRARNLGIEAATGDIVAFIDSDAYPDVNWLYYIVTAMEEQNGAAAGGPNIPPPGDGFIAECVDCSPGNPTHVLLDDSRAEHIPGCNMAFRKQALREIGLFDATHRTAGDDVDVCWKLLVRNKTIAFSPGAVVYHHRRGTVKGYLKQQRGYGFAEAHLQCRYPGRYNFSGCQVWRGNIYDTPHTGLRENGVPLLFNSRVYQGTLGGAQFQSVYQPFLTWWFQIFTAAEWQGLTVLTLASGAAGLYQQAPGAWVATGAGILQLLLGVGSAVLCATQSSRRAPWKGLQRTRGVTTVSFLHLAQPLARAWGRIKGWWAQRNEEIIFPPSRRLYGNLLQRDQFLHRLPEHLKSCGWMCDLSSEWSETDLEIPGPGPCRLSITTVYEDDVAHSCHYIRYRVKSQMKPGGYVMILLLVMALAGIAMNPWLLPLALPIVFLLRRYLLARRTTLNAVSQLTEEMGGALGMTKALDDF
jgi:glycosyltransferase involved in cell wall biosynthesis